MVTTRLTLAIAVAITAHLMAIITEALLTMVHPPTTTALPNAVVALVLVAHLDLLATINPVATAPDPPAAALDLLVTTMIATRPVPARLAREVRDS